MRKLKTLAITSMLFGLSVGTVQAKSYYDYARVMHVQPVYHYVKVSQPVEQCYPVEYRSKVRKHHRVAHEHAHRKGSTVVGAVIGGVIGNAIGKATGKNRKVSTIAGAIIGGSVGHRSHQDRYDRYYHTRVRTEERCEVVYEKTKKVREIKGYNVKYRYQGEAYKTFMHNHPGDKIKVRVRVSPAGYY